MRWIASISAVYHPVAFAAWIVLDLAARNADEVITRDIIGPLAVVLGITVVLYLILQVVTRNTLKAGLILTSFLLAFFSYSAIREIMSSLCNYLGLPLFRHAINSIDVAETDTLIRERYVAASCRYIPQASVDQRRQFERIDKVDGILEI